MTAMRRAMVRPQSLVTGVQSCFPRFGHDGRIRASRLAPRASRLAPRASRLAPRASRLAPRASRLAPRASRLAPRASRLAPRASRLAPRASRLAPRASRLAPRASRLAPRASRLAPRASRLAPRASRLAPHLTCGRLTCGRLTCGRLTCGRHGSSPTEFPSPSAVAAFPFLSGAFGPSTLSCDRAGFQPVGVRLRPARSHLRKKPLPPEHRLLQQLGDQLRATALSPAARA